MTVSLDLAESLLAGEVNVSGHSVKAAAWIARTELEALIRDLVEQQALRTGSATTRSLLSCIESLYAERDPDLAATTDYAWSALSKAAHHHAYDLPPTHAEVANLVATVRRLSQIGR